MTAQHITRLGFGLLMLVLSAACGWSNAAQTYKERRPKEDQPRVEYIMPEAPIIKVEKKDDCEVGSFTLFMVEEGSRLVKEMKCETGQVLSLTRSDMTHEELRTWRMKNVPVGEWYLMVDPASQNRGNRKTVTNENLMGISKIYSLKYYQKMADTGYIIYTFHDKQP